MNFEIQKESVADTDTFNNDNTKLDIDEFGPNHLKKTPKVEESTDREKYNGLNEKEKEKVFNSPIPDRYLSKEEIEKRESEKILTIKEKIKNFFNFHKN